MKKRSTFSRQSNQANGQNGGVSMINDTRLTCPVPAKIEGQPGRGEVDDYNPA
jgi:hypothetical protein